mmetsp:Transcript_6837/g.19846  ORF Transcript_6837/g.19846 Transcript_6837/m.19846 type:complete len:582 (-) Transcript_6837:255-2000(-)
MLGRGFRRAAGLALGSGALLAAHSRLDDRRVPSSWPVRSAAACEAAASELPTFRRDDVAKHAGGDAGVWVMLGSRVFDITHFIENHPGGMDKIMMAAGKSLEPFWALYRQHVERAGEDGSIEAKEHVEQLLQEYQIGWLHPDDVKEAAACARAADDPYANQPARHPALKVLSEIPCSAELPASLMMDSWLTPAPLWYVRHHHPVPDLDADSFRLRVHGLGVQDREYSLAQLQALAQKAEVAVTVQCGGNRRGEYNDVRKTSGNEWGTGAISNARFGGVRLSDVLRDAGVSQPAEAVRAGVQHVHFEGSDGCRVSVPAKKALDEAGDVLLAWEMNGEPLPRDHGYPLRVLVPGHVGVRQVKWLTEVKLAEEDAPGMWNRGLAYKVFGPSVTSVTEEEIAATPTMQEMPVQSMIAEPRPNAKLDAGSPVDVRGVAWSGGGRGIVRVDVSADGGASWHKATLAEGSEQPPDRAWAWTFWEAEVPVAEAEGATTIICKATDAAHNSQPESVAGIWNLRGLNNNSWHRVPVVAIGDGDDDEAASEPQAAAAPAPPARSNSRYGGAFESSEPPAPTSEPRYGGAFRK